MKALKIYHAHKSKTYSSATEMKQVYAQFSSEGIINGKVYFQKLLNIKHLFQDLSRAFTAYHEHVDCPY